MRKVHSLVLRQSSEELSIPQGMHSCYLTEKEKIRGCLLAKAAGADFVKTSTGFGPSGATVEDVTLMRKTVGDELGVKAAGGIRDLHTALKMIETGATLIGTSSSVRIVTGSGN